MVEMPYIYIADVEISGARPQKVANIINAALTDVKQESSDSEEKRLQTGQLACVLEMQRIALVRARTHPVVGAELFARRSTLNHKSNL
jgi:hypothetical protein